MNIDGALVFKRELSYTVLYICDITNYDFISENTFLISMLFLLWKQEKLDCSKKVTFGIIQKIAITVCIYKKIYHEDVQSKIYELIVIFI